ncbi:hypothetical protein Scep_014027 [Stephania cephalantha]|uniref:Berberine/berberine-like domain-containing protein n=1 Tax=Stephania cephalantha TaxID=152367 RepID=A0AAP0J0G8_9MAGN
MKKSSRNSPKNRFVFIFHYRKVKGGFTSSVYKYMTPYASMGPRTAYVNEMDLGFGVMDWGNLSIYADEQVELGRVWGEKYFLRNYDRLVRAKTAINPNNVFRHQQSIPPRQDQGLCTDELFFFNGGSEQNLASAETNLNGLLSMLIDTDGTLAKSAFQTV